MNTPKREFATNLKNAMRREGLNVPDLIEKSGVKERTIDRWLAAETLPQAANLKKIANAVGMKPEELMPNLQDRPDALERIEEKLNRLLENAGLPLEPLDDIHLGAEEELGGNGERRHRQSG